MKIELKNSRQRVVTKYFLDTAEISPFARVESKDKLYQFSVVAKLGLRKKDLLILGLDYDWDDLKSTYIKKNKNVGVLATYMNYTLKLTHTDFNLGIRYDDNREFGEQLSPSFGMVHRFKELDNTFFRINLSRAFHPPPLLWKYFDRDLSDISVNPNIKPESA